MVKKWKEEWKNFPQSKLQKFVACMPCHFQVVRFLKGDNKYKKGRIDGKSDTKRGKQLLAQWEADMARAEAFESLQSEQILLYKDDSSGISSTSSKKKDDNIESIIDENSSEEDV